MIAYRRVTEADRYQISAYLDSGLNRTEIARKLGFHKSTISRELQRNVYAQRYLPRKAHEKAQNRYRYCRRRSKFTLEIQGLIRDLIEEQWSPERIAGRLRLERKLQVSAEGIYKLLRARPELGAAKLARARRWGAGRYIQRKAQEGIQTIHQRSESVNQRRALGHWERDGMYGASRQQLLVFAERKSRFVVIKKMGTGIPTDVTRLTNDMLKEIPLQHRSITNDRGPEFRDFANLPLPTYFCDVQKPQQKGTVEHQIGRLRYYIPRKTNLTTITDQQLQEVQNRINSRPMKVLGYRTPYEVLYNVKVALVN